MIPLTEKRIFTCSDTTKIQKLFKNRVGVQNEISDLKPNVFSNSQF